MRIDLNADLAEECGDDSAVLACVSSANIAAGAYAGGARAIDAALAEAARLGVTVGAHVGYEDRANFGRVAQEVPEQVLAASLLEQVERVQDHAARFGLRVQYVKPHGALYHRVGVDEVQARALVAAVRTADAQLELLVPKSPALEALAAPLRCRQEFFADRGYHLDGHLVDRRDPRAHVHEVEAVVARTLYWLRTGEVLSVEGKVMRIDADSICLHGDTPQAVQFARALRHALEGAGVRVCNWMAS